MIVKNPKIKSIIYIVGAVLCFYIAYSSHRKNEINYDILENGVITTSFVTEKPKDCKPSIKAQNYLLVKLPDGKEFNLFVTYKECSVLNIGDSISVKYKKGINVILNLNPSLNHIHPEVTILGSIIGGIFLIYTMMTLVGIRIRQ